MAGEEKSCYFFGADLGFTTKGGGVVDSVKPDSQADDNDVQEGWKVVAIDDEVVPPAILDSDLVTKIKQAIVRGGDCAQITFRIPPPSALQPPEPPEPAQPSQPPPEEPPPVAEEPPPPPPEKAVVKPPVEAAATLKEAPPDAAKVQQQQASLKDLHSLSEAKRCENLSRMEQLSTEEVGMVLKDQNAVKSLLSAQGAEELTVLLRERSVSEVNAARELGSRLATGAVPTPEEAKNVDLMQKDNRGNTPMHMARNARSFIRLLESATEAECRRSSSKRRGTREVARELMGAVNFRGETPMETALRSANLSQSTCCELVQFFTERVPEVLRETMHKVMPLVPNTTRAEVLRPKASWPDVREVLLAGSAKAVKQGYLKLASPLVASVPGLSLEDHSGVWVELLVEHCFGVMRQDPDTGGTAPPQQQHQQMVHTNASQERLGAVWQALRHLLEACSDPQLPAEEANELKGITKGLLGATKGPSVAPTDPREPYRERLVGLVHELQRRTASLLRTALEAASTADPAASNELLQLPQDELRGVDTRAAQARGAPGRLRMDSPVLSDSLRVGAGGTVGDALLTPEWVLHQNLDRQLFEDLRRWGCVGRACDVLDITGGLGGSSSSSSISPVVLEGLTEDRLRFCRLHAAWLRGICGEQQEQLAKHLRGAVGLAPGAGTGKDGPWEAGGGSKVSFFRTRAEAKGLPRILEKMAEALDEEVRVGETRSLLQKGQAATLADAPQPPTPDTKHKPSEHELASLRELLTPACYICDVNGAEVVVDSLKDMMALYWHLCGLSLQREQCQVVRVKNGFSRELREAEVDSKGGYRDLKLWLMVLTGNTRLVAELQVHLRSFYELKRVMHLPYECSRGSFDHPHLHGLWQVEPRAKPKCCCGVCVAM